MIPRLLVASDLSGRAARAVARARRLQERDDASLLALHVVDDDLSDEVARRRAAEARAALEQALGLAGAPAEGRTAVAVRFGAPDLEIVRQADATGAGLIVLGASRPSTLGDWLRGTTVERVLRHGSTPVLVARDAADRDYRSVLLATDFSVHARRALATVAAVAPGAELTVLHAFDTPFAGLLSQQERHEADLMRDEIAAEMQAFLAGAPAGLARITPLVQMGDPVAAVAEAAQRLQSDLLAVGTHGRAGVARALLGSVAERLIAGHAGDVLAVRAW